MFAVHGGLMTAAPITGPANLILNGTFNDATGWTNLGFAGKSITGGKLVFLNTDAYEAAYYVCTMVVGKYYESTYTISGYSAGNVNLFLSGGTDRAGTIRTANGTYTERLLANTGNVQVGIRSNDVIGTYSVDNVSLIGPYTTSTVGGA